MHRPVFAGLLFLVHVQSALAADLRVSGSLVSTAPDGVPPLVVESGSPVVNLNADMLDGVHLGDFSAPGGGPAVHWKNIVGLPVLEIDAACAQAGCFPGDAAGYPVTINQPGSYRLAGNLDVSGETAPEDVTAVRVEVSGVYLDLGGFAIFGPTTCTGSPVTGCTPVGFGYGVRADSGLVNIVIRNGTIQGMGGDGIHCSGSCRVDGISAAGNGGRGIQVVTGGLVQNCHSQRNNHAGIDAAGVIGNNRVEFNRNDGIVAVFGSVVTDNSIFRNAGRGILAGQSVLLAGNSVLWNDSVGIRTSSGVQIKGNTVGLSGSHGIECFDCSVVDNVLQENTGTAIVFLNTTDDNGAWSRNLLSGNGATVSGIGLSLGDNVCNGGAC